MAESFKKVAIAYKRLGQHRQDNTAKRHLQSEERFMVNNMLTLQQVTATWEISAKSLNNTIKLKSVTRRLSTSEKIIHGEYHADVATSYSILGDINADLGQHDQARKYHEKALTIREYIHRDKRHADVTTSCTKLGDAYLHLRQRDQAKSTTRRPLPLEERFVVKAMVA